MIKSIMKKQVFFIYLSFRMVFFVLSLRKCLFQFLCCLLCYLLMQETFQTAAHKCSSKQVFLKFRNIHRKAPELKPLFNKVSGLKACFLFKKETPTQVFFWEYCEIFENGFFIEDLFVIPFRNFI